MISAAILFGVAAGIATFLGGLLAFRLRQRFDLVLGLTSGIVLGIGLLELLPEALELSRGAWSGRALAAWTATGFACYMLLSRFSVPSHASAGGWRAHLGPATLTMHSLLDGFGIGVAFGIDKEIGRLVAVAVLAHDVADGINIVSLSLTAQSVRQARLWLVLNGVAPLVGVLLGTSLSLSAVMLAPILALFAGVFVYLGACELMPRSRALNPGVRTSIATLVGMALMFIITSRGH